MPVGVVGVYTKMESMKLEPLDIVFAYGDFLATEPEIEFGGIREVN